MPLNPILFGTNIQTAGIASGLLGTEFGRVASALGDGICKSLLLPGILSATLTGVSGVGVVSAVSPPIIVPPVLAADILLGMTSVGITGVAAAQEATAIANGISMSMALAAVVGTCPTVSTGGGTALLTNYPPSTLYSLLMASATMYGLVGTEVSRKMDGLSKGISIGLMKMVAVPLVAVGPPIPPPPVGPVPSGGVGIVNFL